MSESLCYDWYKIEYIYLGQTIFAHKSYVEIKAANANDVVHWFIEQKELNKKDWFIIEIYKREYVKGRTKWAPQLTIPKKQNVSAGDNPQLFPYI